MPVIRIPLQVPAIANRSIFDFQNDPKTSENFTSQDVSSGVALHQFQVQDSATIPFFQFNRNQRIIPVYNPCTDFIKQIQNSQTVTSQPLRSNDQTFILNTITKTVPNLSRLPLAPLNIADTYSLNGTSNNLFKQSQT